MSLSEELELELESFVDGELEAEEELRISRILARSEAARQWVADRRRLLQRLRDLPESIAPRPDLWTEVLEQVTDPAEATSDGTHQDNDQQAARESVGPNETSELPSLPPSIQHSAELDTDQSNNDRTVPSSLQIPLRNRSWTPLLLAACLIAALGLGFLLGRSQDSVTRDGSGQDSLAGFSEGSPTQAGHRASTDAQGSNPEIGLAAQAGDRTAVSEAEAALLSAKVKLRRALAVHRNSLPPQTVATVDQNLATIERAIADIRAALDQSPGDAGLQRALVAYHQREVALLTQVTRAAARL